MEAIFILIAAVAGAALGWVQFWLLQRIILKGKTWLIAIKLPLWALCMIAAVAVSLSALISLVVCATASFLALGYAQRRSYKGG
jgi:NhaP-type Na+/H+ or K+/H+ antiporter